MADSHFCLPFAFLQHNKEDDLWIIIDSAVYDLSKFVDLHPGGAHVLLQVAGQGSSRSLSHWEGSSRSRISRSCCFVLADATEAFFGMHRSEVLTKYGRYLIGTISGQKPVHILPTPGTLSPVPYAEPMWLAEGYKSPYYNDSHRRLQKYIREFNDEFVRPDAQLHELDGKRPTPELIRKMGDLKINHMVRCAGRVLTVQAGCSRASICSAWVPTSSSTASTCRAASRAKTTTTSTSALLDWLRSADRQANSTFSGSLSLRSSRAVALAVRSLSMWVL